VTPAQSITAWQVAGIAVLWLAIAALDLENAARPTRASSREQAAGANA